MKTKDFFPLVKKAYESWSEDKASRLAASLSYFTIFSLAPTIIVAIGIASMIFVGQHDLIQEQVKTQLTGTLGETAADGVQLLLDSANKGQGDARPILATIVGFITILLGASGLFSALQDSLNTIWGVEPKPGAGIMATIRARFASFAMVLGIGFLLLVSLVLSTGIQSMTQQINSHIGEVALLGQALNLFVGFFVTMLLFAAMYKVLPDVKIQWRDVWIGAAVTSFLFSVGRFGLGYYLAKSGTSSSYGPAGALIVLLLWVYYAAQILFFGAEFTKVYANQFGSKILPDDDAVAVTAEARAEQGMSPAQKHGGATKAPVSSAGASKSTTSKPNLAKKPQMALSEEAMAEQRRNFEFTLAVVAGGILISLWNFRKKRD